MLTTRQIPTLFNGVSQQPPPTRLSSQCEEQFNCTSSVVDGVRKRSPSEHIAKLTSDHLTDAYLHSINRDVQERYQVVITESGIRVFDLAGNEKTVTAPLGWDYLALPAGATPRFTYVAMTVADYTFVLNKSKTVAMLAVGADQDPPSDDYWWLNRPLSDAALPIRAPIDEPDPGDPYDGGGNPTQGSPTTGTYTPNPTASSITGTVQSLQDLPINAANGSIYKIAGTSESGFSSYYVVKKSGAWFETVAPGLRNLVDATTMPHALVRQGDGTFIFGPFAWSPRRVGDEQSNPHPTFVGRQIRDIYFEKNRLGMCVDENNVLSRVGDFGNFYRLTVVDYLDDDVIDIAASENQVTKMEFAVPVGQKLMLFSDQVQFALTWAQGLTGRSVSLDVSTRYPMTPGVRPAPSGSDVYFPSHSAGWTILREYFVNQDGLTNDASDVTAHVPTYIPYGVRQVVAAPEHDQVFVLTSGATNRVYVYGYYWQSETEKAMSSWNYWEFDDACEVIAATVLGGYLYLLIDRADGTHLERIALFYGSLAADLDFQVYLDRRCEVTGVYDSGTDYTTFTLPYDLPTAHRGNFRVVFGNAFTGRKGAAVAPSLLTWLGANSFKIEGDLSAGTVACGLVYTKRFVFSQQFPQDRNGNSVLSGRLQLKSMSVHFTDTAYFRAEVKPYGAAGETTYTQHFPAYRASVEGAGLTGAPIFREGKATFGVQANAAEVQIALVNDSHLGSCFNSAEWTGFYSNLASA
jgi:hypothetical protein